MRNSAVVPIDRIAVGEDGKPQSLILHRRALVLERLNRPAIPELRFTRAVPGGMQMSHRVLDIRAQIGVGRQLPTPTSARLAHRSLRPAAQR